MRCGRRRNKVASNHPSPPCSGTLSCSPSGQLLRQESPCCVEAPSIIRTPNLRINIRLTHPLFLGGRGRGGAPPWPGCVRATNRVELVEIGPSASRWSRLREASLYMLAVHRRSEVRGRNCSPTRVLLKVRVRPGVQLRSTKVSTAWQISRLLRKLVYPRICAS